MNSVLSFVERVLSRAKASSDVVLAAVMALIVAALIIPLPSWALDAGIAVNFATSLSLLVAALYAKDALKVAAFPTALLLTTLFRLAMNVSSTRLALSEGHAGDIIQAFGEFVVRGDYVVGAVIFAILTLVQFLVVTKGAERVAEVSARFTLDAMPGKQMSIDADLRAGAITQDQARARRHQLERESQMFGAMDGAMKFVKGDVIAGLVITFINLIGGTIIGMIQGGMSASEAAGTYALISIGDGLVSQIPSLCITVAAGLVVTRVSSDSQDASLGSDIGAQFFGQWKALYIVSGLCLLLALMPGMPHVTFVIIATVLAVVATALRRMANAPQTATVSKKPEGAAKAPSASSTNGSGTMPVGVTPLTIDLSADLTFLAETDDTEFVTSHLNRAREKLQHDLGVRIPAFRVRTGAPLAPHSWVLAIDEIPAGRGNVLKSSWFTTASSVELTPFGVAGTPTIDPSNGRPMLAISSEAKEKLATTDFTVKSLDTVIVDHVVSCVRKRAATFLGVQDVQAMLTELESSHPALVKEATAKIPLPLMTDVLRRLLQEQVSIRNLRLILETLVGPSTEGDVNQLADRCRVALARQLTHQYASSGPLYAFLVDPEIEETLRRAGTAMEPSQASAVLEGVKRIAKQGRAVLLASPDVRRMLRKLVEGAFPDVAVLTFAELDPEAQIRPLGRVSFAKS